jgi:hypothetical protein
MLKVVENATGGEAGEQFSELHEIIRMGARRMLMAALEMEAADYVERHRHAPRAGALMVHKARVLPQEVRLLHMKGRREG